ncbi:radical SAM protein [Roseospira navarrensis]|uniref:Radical SAM protein n=1 Tax=Roseospira navarrensis TaxID=140058 RepID=A0A7X1ZGG3_9PROT|nr:radical SAM protein [Roseospira navarrensis]MQX38099.1 radical SAM protein [Roseospira navarrensis]
MTGAPESLRPIELVVLQGTPFCNMNCGYCDLSPDSRRQKRTMPLAVVSRVFAEVLASPWVAETLTVIWHSGEPLTLPPAYYDDAIAEVLAVRDRVAPGRVAIRFSIQTNGVLIDDAWIAFFQRHAHHLDIGVSCDGPAALHDAWRTNWAGKPSHAATVRGMDRLAAAGLPFKAIAVVTGHTLDDPDGFFRFFFERRAALTDLHFNILADGASGTDPALRFTEGDRARYHAFYSRLLALSAAHADADPGFVIQNFRHGLARLLDAAPGRTASHHEESSAPLKALSVDAGGRVTTFYAGLAPETHADLYGDGQGLSLGNIMETPLAEMARSLKLRRMLRDFRASRDACAADCAYFGVCTGGFELTKVVRHGRFDATETPECVIHVQALTDALLDDVALHLDAQEADADPRAAGTGA